MQTLGLRELNQNPSRAVAQVRETGVPLVITDRGRPVVRLVPERTDERSNVLQQMVDAGEARPPIERRLPEPLRGVAPDVESLSVLVVADRERERNR